MDKKTIKLLWMKSIITIIWLFSSLTPLVYATWETWEVNFTSLRNTVMLNNDENSLINWAIDRVSKLQTDIDKITDELFKLDEE